MLTCSISMCAGVYESWYESSDFVDWLLTKGTLYMASDSLVIYYSPINPYFLDFRNKAIELVSSVWSILDIWSFTRWSCSHLSATFTWLVIRFPYMPINSFLSPEALCNRCVRFLQIGLSFLSHRNGIFDYNLESGCHVKFKIFSIEADHQESVLRLLVWNRSGKVLWFSEGISRGERKCELYLLQNDDCSCQ